jgi:hypothetical protein
LSIQWLASDAFAVAAKILGVHCEHYSSDSSVFVANVLSSSLKKKFSVDQKADKL